MAGAARETLVDSKMTNCDLSEVLSKMEVIESTLKSIEENTKSEEKLVKRDNSDLVTVFVRTSIISVGEIDTQKQQFTCDLFVLARWKEPRLKGRKKDKDINWSQEWHPRIVFFNALATDMKEERRFIEEDDDDEIPYACQSFRLSGTFREKLELNQFPLDFQELTVTLMSDWTDKRVKFEKDMKRKDFIRHETFTSVQEWNLQRFVITETKSTEHGAGSSNNNYPLYHMRSFVKRRNGFYLWNVAFVIFLITALSFTSFSVQINEPADRLSVTLTLLLTAIAFKFVVSACLPTISYLTLLDTYVISSLVFLFCIAVENGLVGALPENVQYEFDKICLYIAIAIFVVIHIIALIVVFYKKRQVVKTIRKYAKRYQDVCKEIDKGGMVDPVY